jgi:hypothetical protein
MTLDLPRYQITSLIVSLIVSLSALLFAVCSGAAVGARARSDDSIPADTAGRESGCSVSTAARDGDRFELPMLSTSSSVTDLMTASSTALANRSFAR